MSALSRETTLQALEIALSASDLDSVRFVRLVGRVLRVAHGDDHDLAARADALLEAARPGPALDLDRLGNASRAPLPSHDQPAFFSALVEATALLAGLAFFDRAPEARAQLAAATREAATRGGVDPLSPAAVALAIRANEHIAEEGAVPGPDDALLALADGLSPVLRAVFRGERSSVLAAAVAVLAGRERPLSADERARLGDLLARALDRSAPLAIAPELLELTPYFLASAAPELVLHEEQADVTLIRQLLPGVLLRAHADVLEIELEEGITVDPLLLPIVGEAALAPCRFRAGATSRHFVFEPCDHPAVEGYALLVGDRVALLRALAFARFRCRALPLPRASAGARFRSRARGRLSRVGACPGWAASPHRRGTDRRSLSANRRSLRRYRTRSRRLADSIDRRLFPTC